MDLKKSFNFNIIDIFIIGTISIIFFLILDAFLTKIFKVRGFSRFFESNPKVGFINKRGFEGRFGGPLDDFSNIVTINNYGVRNVSKIDCSDSSASIDKNLIFVGDSILAGFEVDDKDHYVSKLSEKCISRGELINGGVRAHDTHMASANAVRIIKEYNFRESNSIIIYGLSANDYIENYNRDKYYNLKARFGSIYNQKLYKPKANSSYLNLRMFIGDNFYFSTKLISEIEKYKYLKSSIYPSLSNDKCKRVFSILNKTIFKDLENVKVVLYVHPSFKDFKKTERIESCLLKSSFEYPKISFLPIHKYIEMTMDSKNYKNYIFRRDSHYNKKGHDFFSKIIFEKLNKFALN